MARLVRARDLPLERHLTDLAARAAGLPNDRGLRAFADARCIPGPIQTPRDWDQEAAEEIADCANYLAWGLIEDHPGYLAGEPVATARFERRLRALRRQVESWHELFTDAHSASAVRRTGHNRRVITPPGESRG